MNARGYTLVEMLVTLAVVAILAVVAVPAFRSFTANQEVKTAAQTLYASLLYARTEALKRNDEVYVRSNGGGGDDWDQGWFVTTDPALAKVDCGSTAAVAGVLRAFCAVRGSGVDFSGAPAEVAYSGGGRAAPASFLLCDGDARARTVRVALGGQASIERTGSCP